eukprot:gnl/TRDRNA2_/TRDRNA2_100848_c1_seq1.p1 gnl/TRDRNA2_/TRDRNA2_100848_c1~~gnl/TRDRNA2_/TRDRNA2_100848_c1_seq1.p1  ORF type:complete len:590 (+),score=112.01 gnl/TRDRNA2_/TRDRNA2_100848_c1_seq1:162-1772(+)
MSEEGRPRNPLAQFGFDEASKNPFDNALVAMDEAHNMLAMPGYPAQCMRLKSFLSTSTRTTLVCLTGTPVPDNGKVALADLEEHLLHSREELMGIIKGRSPNILAALVRIGSFCGMSVVWADFMFNAALENIEFREAGRSDHGFICSYHGPLPGDTAKVLCRDGTPWDPAKLCQDALQHAVQLPPIMAARYAVKHQEKKGDRRLLQAYTNLEVFYAHMLRNPFLSRSLATPEQYTPKLLWIAQQVVRHQDKKAVVLIKQRTGYAFFRKLLEHVRDQAGETFGIAGLKERALFNDRFTNLRGERYRVLVAEAVEAGEGSNFLNVRDLYLADCPASASELSQYISRCDRGDGHAGLPPDERTVRVQMVCGKLPEDIGESSLRSFVWKELVDAQIRGQKGQRPDDWEKVMRKFQKTVQYFEDKFYIDIDDFDSLDELREQYVSLTECEDADPFDSDSNSLSQYEKVLKFMKSVGLTHSLNRLASKADTRFQSFRRSLCLRSVDEDVCQELAQRCSLVQQAHKVLKDAAMDRSVLEHILD